jgi:hypothetical protein
LPFLIFLVYYESVVRITFKETQMKKLITIVVVVAVVVLGYLGLTGQLGKVTGEVAKKELIKQPAPVVQSHPTLTPHDQSTYNKNGNGYTQPAVVTKQPEKKSFFKSKPKAPANPVVKSVPQSVPQQTAPHTGGDIHPMLQHGDQLSRSHVAPVPVK